MQQLSLRRLEYFLAVVHDGTVTAAAERLHVAQPALSRQIKVLEGEIGARLFAAHGNRLRLTPLGRALVPVAQRLVEQSNEARAAVRDLVAGHTTQLRVAATATTIRSLLAPFIARLGPEDPLLLTRAGEHFGLFDLLHDDVDLVVSPLPPPRSLDAMLIGTAPLRAIVHAEHELARRDVLSCVEVAAHPVVLGSTATVSRLELDAAMRRAGVAYEQLLESVDGPSLQAVAVSGRAIGVTTEPLTESLRAKGTRLIPVTDADGEPLMLRLHAGWVPEHHARETIRGLVERLAAVSAEQLA